MKKQTKVGKVMHEFKTGKLHSGKSGKIVKNPKQAIAIALSEARKSTKGYAKGGEVIAPTKNQVQAEAHDVDFSQFTNEDGYMKGGIDVEVSNPLETQEQPVRGQRRMMPEKRKIAKWF
jgi:Family of unknown function (DUF6496)